MKFTMFTTFTRSYVAIYKPMNLVNLVNVVGEG